MNPRTKSKPLGKVGENGDIGYQDALAAGRAVKALLESEGWKVLTQAIEEKLRHAQYLTIQSQPSDDNAAKERMFGRWDGLTEVAQIAEGIVSQGELALAELQRRGA